MMLYQFIHHADGFSLCRSPATPEGVMKVRGVTLDEIKQGGAKVADEELCRFFLAVQVLITGEKRHRWRVKQLTTAGVREFKTGVRPTAEYLEMLRYPDIVKKKNYWNNRSKAEMENYEELENLLKTAFAPVKARLGFPAQNPSEYSYTVPDSAIVATTPACRNYLKSLVTHGVLTSSKFERIKGKLKRDFPDQADAIIEALEDAKARTHLSAVSINESNRETLVSIVNVNGDLLRLEGYKFLRLIEEHDRENGGWLNLGSLERQEEWLPEPLMKLNAEKSGDVIARYVAKDSCFEVRHLVTTGKKGNKSEVAAQPHFIIDQDYLVCLYLALLRLKRDKARFNELREAAATRPMTTMAELEADLF